VHCNASRERFGTVLICANVASIPVEKDNKNTLGYDLFAPKVEQQNIFSLYCNS
jgi:hypothetical protein